MNCYAGMFCRNGLPGREATVPAMSWALSVELCLLGPFSNLYPGDVLTGSSPACLHCSDSFSSWAEWSWRSWGLSWNTQVSSRRENWTQTPGLHSPCSGLENYPTLQDAHNNQLRMALPFQMRNLKPNMKELAKKSFIQIMEGSVKELVPTSI